jgi:DNA-binding transcriptional ArsR family regulator
MPKFDQDFIRLPQPVTVSFALEPVRNILNSFCLIAKLEELPGVDAWVTHTAAALTPAQLHTHVVVCEGLYFAIQPDRAYPDFPAYLAGLEAQEPRLLRDRLFEAYARIARSKALKRDDTAPLPGREALLASLEAFLAFEKQSFSHFSDIDIPIETEAHALLNDPPAMQKLIVSHLRDMWDRFMAAEWERVRPMLQESVDAFQQLDLAGQTPVEIARAINPALGEGHLAEILAQAERVVFVPSAHQGPYAGKFTGEHEVVVFFGARLPEGASTRSPALTRSELLVRLNALADDARLSILNLLAEHDELCAQDIMTRLGLSQSAASRHLRQLSATGYLVERRREGAKCYRLNRDRFQNTIRALEQFVDKA